MGCKLKINILINDDLIEEAFKYSSAKTKRDLIHRALVEFVERRKRRNLLDLKGKIKFAKNYDYKA